MHSLRYQRLSEMVFNEPQYATAAVMDSVKAALMPQLNLTVVNAPIEQELSKEVQAPRKGDGQQVGVIPVHGVLATRGMALDEACNPILSYEVLRNQIQAALDDPEINTIVLDIYSGGGMAVGCYELAEFIYENRDTKPIIAIVNYYAYSAAYFIAAACSEIYVPTTGGVGSIGVRLEHVEFSKMAENQGITFTTFVRGARKADLSDTAPLSQEAIQSVDRKMDANYELFVSSVAKYRNLSVDAVKDTQADCFTGKEALELGLADHLMNPQEAINKVASTIPQSSKKYQLQAQAMAMKTRLHLEA